MRVGAPDHAEIERVEAELIIQQEAFFQAIARHGRGVNAQGFSPRYCPFCAGREKLFEAALLIILCRCPERIPTRP